MGEPIAKKQTLGLGKSIVPSLSSLLNREFPGFSITNLWYMVQFYNEYMYHGDVNLQPLVWEISSTKHFVILSKCKDSQERQFYSISIKKYGWT